MTFDWIVLDEIGPLIANIAQKQDIENGAQNNSAFVP